MTALGTKHSFAVLSVSQADGVTFFDAGFNLLSKKPVRLTITPSGVTAPISYYATITEQRFEHHRGEPSLPRANRRRIAPYL